MGSRCQKVVVRMVFCLVTRSELEARRTVVLVPGFWFHHVLVGSLKGPQMTCSLAFFLELRVSALPEVTQLV